MNMAKDEIEACLFSEERLRLISPSDEFLSDIRGVPEEISVEDA